MLDEAKELYAALIEARRNGSTHEIYTHGGILDAGDNLFYVVMAESDADALDRAADWLSGYAEAVLRRGAVPVAPDLGNSPVLALRTRTFAETVASGGLVTSTTNNHPVHYLARMQLLLRSLAVGPKVLMNGAALALCMGLAMCMKYVIPPNHWYWVPLTVALVMKPDLGSVFGRAMLRSIGTCIGVVIGAMLMALLPKGPVLVVVIAGLAALLPWAKSVSYAVLALALTPLVLILLDLMTPGLATTDYGPQRLENTFIGAGIALVFGYFVWPRSRSRELATSFSCVMAALSDYLAIACRGPEADAARAGRDCYVKLSDLRTILARCMAEPPPAGREAAAWIPLLASGERMCDRIAEFVASRSAEDAGLPQAEVERVVLRLRNFSAPAPAECQEPGMDPMLAAILAECRQISRRLEAATPA